MKFFLLLFLEFLKMGLFTVGGGLATLPFLYDIAGKYHWWSAELIPDMLAVAQSTPGAVGVNLIAFAGFSAGGVPGAVIAAIGLVVPPTVIVIIVARFLDKFKENFYVDSVFYGLRPAACAMICSATFEVIRVTLINFERFHLTGSILSLFEWKSLSFFVIIYFLMAKFKKNPIFYIVGAAIVGILLKF